MREQQSISILDRMKNTTALVGSDKEGTAGWYKVASQTMSGYGNTNITFMVTSTYGYYNMGILQLQMRADDTSISCKRLGWLSRVGFNTSHYIIVISGMKWTLYAYQPQSRYGRLCFEILSRSSTSSNKLTYALEFANNETMESTTPNATVTSSDISIVASANTLSTTRTFTIGSSSKTFNGSSNVSWSLSEIGAAASNHTHNYLPLSGGTISSSSFGPVFVERSGSSHGASIGFKNSNGVLGYIGMYGTVNSGLTRWSADTKSAYTVLDTGNYKSTITPANIGAAASSHSHSNYLTTSGGTMLGTISSSLITGTYLKGNQGNALLSSKANAGDYVTLLRYPSTNGIFTLNGHQSKFIFGFTSNSTISAGTNKLDKKIFIDENGNISVDGNINASNGLLTVSDIYCISECEIDRTLTCNDNLIVNSYVEGGKFLSRGSYTTSGKDYEATLYPANLVLRASTPSTIWETSLTKDSLDTGTMETTKNIMSWDQSGNTRFPGVMTLKSIMRFDGNENGNFHFINNASNNISDTKDNVYIRTNGRLILKDKDNTQYIRLSTSGIRIQMDNNSDDNYASVGYFNDGTSPNQKGLYLSNQKGNWLRLYENGVLTWSGNRVVTFDSNYTITSFGNNSGNFHIVNSGEGSTFLRVGDSTSSGLYVKDYSSSSYAPVIAAKFTVSSEEKWKTNIEEVYDNASEIINNATIYKYDLLSEKTNDQRNIGLVIDRETPEQIINVVENEDGTVDKTIDLYKMSALAWKAIQEHNCKKDELESESSMLMFELAKRDLKIKELEDKIDELIALIK